MSQTRPARCAFGHWLSRFALPLSPPPAGKTQRLWQATWRPSPASISGGETSEQIAV